MSHKLGVCIPYRNRKEHVERLIPHLSQHLTAQGIDHAFYVGHQIDNKLFNRGAMKNIAAHVAFEDGCDYIAWHDVDMLTYNKDGHIGGDYSYPEENPIHIATKLSKYGYGLGYDQYFGGVVLFTKEQAYQTNGYSNDYWDWGQEDDDLFWRCYFEGMTTGDIFKKYENKKVLNFNGNDSHVSLETNREISNALKEDHTISILFNAQQQEEKVPIWLVGDLQKRFIEYPLLRKEGSWNWGLSFNNSRAVTMQYFDKFNNPIYNWAKRFENLWTWVTLSYSKEKNGIFFYINDELVCQMNGIKQNIPFPVYGELRAHNSIQPFLIGYCNHSNTRYKGKIAEVKIFDKFFENVNDVFDNENTILKYDFNNESGDNNVIVTEENIEIVENIVPYRREGSFYCLPHEDEGFVNGTWKKGATTARNEKRFVTEMQQGKIDYKNDGLKNVLDVLDIDNIDETLYPKTKFINVKMKENV
jgi:hypothetical protein